MCDDANEVLLSPRPGSPRHVKKIGKYRLGRTLGTGAYSKVKAGVDVETGETYALKIIHKQQLTLEGVEHQIRREIAIMMHLRHDNVLKLKEVLQTDHSLFLVLELVTGGDLLQRLLEAGHFDEDTSRQYIQQIVSAVSHCHLKGVAHRDLKPQNILLDASGRLKISDFGLSNLQHPTGPRAMLRTVCGTPHYVAPEVLAGEAYDGFKADIWSCGVILFSMLVGEVPFDDPSTHSLFRKIQSTKLVIPPSVSDGARDLLSRMLTVDPKQRCSLREIREHPWFQVGWDAEVYRQMETQTLERSESEIQPPLPQLTTKCPMPNPLSPLEESIPSQSTQSMGLTPNTSLPNSTAAVDSFGSPCSRYALSECPSWATEPDPDVAVPTLSTPTERCIPSACARLMVRQPATGSATPRPPGTRLDDWLLARGLGLLRMRGVMADRTQEQSHAFQWLADPSEAPVEQQEYYQCCQQRLMELMGQDEEMASHQPPEDLHQFQDTEFFGYSPDLLIRNKRALLQRFHPVGLDCRHAAAVTLHYAMMTADLQRNGGALEHHRPINMSQLVRHHFNAAQMEAYVFADAHCVASQLLRQLLPGQSQLVSVPLEDIATNLSTFGPALMELNVYPGFFVERIHRHFGPPLGSSRGRHAMVLIGYRKTTEGLHRYLLQNWWRSKQFVEVDEVYLRGCGASVYFVKNPPQKFNQAWPTHDGHFVDCAPTSSSGH